MPVVIIIVVVLDLASFRKHCVLVIQNPVTRCHKQLLSIHQCRLTSRHGIPARCSHLVVAAVACCTLLIHTKQFIQFYNDQCFHLILNYYRPEINITLKYLKWSFFCQLYLIRKYTLKLNDQ